MTIRTKDLSFGEFINVHRQGEGLNQTEMAKLLGISKQRLCDIEKNRFNISIRLAKSVAKTLKLPPEWLVKLALQDQLRIEGLNLKIG